MKPHILPFKHVDANLREVAVWIQTGGCSVSMRNSLKTSLWRAFNKFITKISLFHSHFLCPAKQRRPMGESPLEMGGRSISTARPTLGVTSGGSMTSSVAREESEGRRKAAMARGSDGGRDSEQ